MTDVEYRLKYPIGTRIRFINPTFDTGKMGTIVAYHSDKPTVYIPTAEKHVKDNYHPISKGVKITWHCGWGEVEPISTVGKQLLFSFMED